MKKMIKDSRNFCTIFLLILMLMGVSMTGCASTPTTSAKSTAAQTTKLKPLISRGGVVLSQSDYRDYDSFMLDNGLQVIVVSDAKADKAAAALNVSVGSGSDPKNFEGLAHFLEHMLFLGTEKYPESGDYQAFIAKHGGGHNAFTSYSDTNYYFDIDASYLEPALDRFSRFFIDPLFTAEFVDREKNAVHSEYQSNLRNDGRRVFDILKQVINTEHPLAKFSVGSLDSLADKEGQSARDAMLKFYKDHYSANLMNLVVVGRESTDELAAMVRSKFSEVPNYEHQKLTEGVPFFAEGQLPKLVKIKPVQTAQSVDYVFPVRNPRAVYERQPLNYLASIIGHEGKGSLLSYLKEKGYAKALSAGPSIAAADEIFFNISVELTQQGYEHLGEVHNAVFGYLKLLRAEGVAYWRFEELRSLLRQDFDYKDIRVDAKWVSDLAGSMSRFPVADVFYGPYKAETYDEKLLWDYIDSFNVDNLLLMLTSPDIETDLVTKRFEATYALGTIDPESIEPLQSDAFALPEPNPFIAEQNMLEVTSMQAPINLSDDDRLSFYYMPNISFKTPKAHQYISLISGYPLESAKNQVLAALLASWALEATNEFSYPAKLAGLDYTFYNHARGVGLRVMGNSAKLDLLRGRLVDTFLHAEISQERFALVKQALEKNLINLRYAPLFRQLLNQTQDLMNTPSFTPSEQLSACENLTVEDLRAFRTEFLQGVYVQALVTGNVTMADAEQTKKLVEEQFAPVLSYEDLAKTGIRKVIKNVHYKPQIDNNDNAWLNILQGANESYEEMALWSLFGHIINPKFYTELRTSQQLGYIVHAGTYTMNDVPGALLLVQSPSYSPDVIQERSDAFLKSFQEMVDVMSEEEFAAQKEGLLTLVLQSSNTLADLSARVWSGINRDYEDRQQLLGDAIKATSLDAFKTLVRDIADGHYKVRVDYAKDGGISTYANQDIKALQNEFGPAFTGRK